jgi:hypothetical protein
MNMCKLSSSSNDEQEMIKCFNNECSLCALYICLGVKRTIEKSVKSSLVVICDECRSILRKEAVHSDSLGNLYHIKKDLNQKFDDLNPIFFRVIELLLLQSFQNSLRLKLKIFWLCEVFRVENNGKMEKTNDPDGDDTQN